ncbi:ATP-binding protein [Streptomyces sp. NPDC052109]|uniref:ATP-binding protein n=1 Tax=Streptomyces sp. NPDC052109 TaxID=3155527 RepID=UPI00341599A6
MRHGHTSPAATSASFLTASSAVGTVRIEVTHILGERLPRLPTHTSEADPRDGGRGLLLVEALADRWGWGDRADAGPGKTVWAECAL